ncbi:hypothetical protein GS481_02660 [Rhodococcus hoagii]|nr:hypothetical protein [Prescottella equi]
MTSTQTAAPALVDPVDRAAVIEQAQRDYATEHTIELTEDEFTLAQADALVRIQRLDLPMTERRLVKVAHASIRSVANGSGRRRPLSKLDLVLVWFSPLLAAVATGWGMWAIRDLRHSAEHLPQYPSWLPSEVINDLPRYMDFFWMTVGVVGGLWTVVAVLAAASATWRTQTYRSASKIASAVGMITMIVLLVLVVSATTYATVMVNLPGAGGGQ